MARPRQWEHGDGKVMVAGDRIRVQTPSIGPSMFDWAELPDTAPAKSLTYR